MRKFLLLLFLTSCQVVSGPDLRRIPYYDAVEANREWMAIEAINADWEKYKMVLSMLVQMQVPLSNASIDSIAKVTDVFLYHRAAATIFLFHGDYPSMNQSLKEARIALDDIDRLILDAVEGKKI